MISFKKEKNFITKCYVVSSTLQGPPTHSRNAVDYLLHKYQRHGGGESDQKDRSVRRTKEARLSSSAMSAARERADLQRLNMNHYATKKTVAESMLDVALLMANASQLKAVLEQGPEFKYYLTVIVLIAVSLFFQVLAGAFFILMARKDLNIVANQKKLDVMNNLATALVFFTVIINIFITAFGVQKTGLYPQQ
ncbi:ninjurin-2 isoform X1 [Pangasianodon hypophthalmus]|nr:ninjurin-2 isoform X1 [Pangasianodon hypophthalmus]